MDAATKLDRIDINILVQLQKDGRMTNVSLAEAVGLSPSPCLQRVKRLESAGYISGYEAHVNLAKFASSVTVFTEVTLSDHKRADFVKFESSIRNIDEVLECHLISGGYDYLVRFLCSSIQHYQELMESILDKNIGIDKYFSYIVIKSPVLKSAVPLRSLVRAVAQPRPQPALQSLVTAAQAASAGHTVSTQYAKHLAHRLRAGPGIGRACRHYHDLPCAHRARLALLGREGHGAFQDEHQLAVARLHLLARIGIALPQTDAQIGRAEQRFAPGLGGRREQYRGGRWIAGRQ